MKLLSAAAFITILTLCVCAEEKPAWGEWRGGLRVGISCEKTEYSADQRPLFTVRIQNDSEKNIYIPGPESYFEFGAPKEKGYHARPLRPQLTTISGTDATYSQSGGEEITKTSHDMTLLKPGEVMTLKDVPLEVHSYVVGRESAYNGKVTRQRLYPLPDSEYRVQFAFENEHAEWGASKLWCGLALSNSVTLKITKPPLDRYKIEAGFTLPKQEYFVGEPVVAEFKVTNRGDEEFAFPYGGDYRGSGRPERYSFTAVGEDGVAVADPVPNPINRGGMGGDRRIKPGESYTESVVASAWLILEKPGKYTITGKRTLNLHPARNDHWYEPEAICAAYPVESKITITLKQDDAALLSRIEKLVEDFGRKGEERDRASVELGAIARTRNSLALPAFKRIALDTERYGNSSWWWLQEYGKNQAGPTLLEVFSKAKAGRRSQLIGMLAAWRLLEEKHLQQAFTSSDQWEREAAVRAVGQLKFDKCFDALVALEKDPSQNVRRSVPESLAVLEKQEAIPVLLRMMSDDEKDMETQINAAKFLGKFKRTDGVPVLLNMLNNSNLRNHEHSIKWALREITGQNFDNYKEWLKWWHVNQPRPPQ
jgi:hypothetical protein